jgi:hypothetical protein
MAQVTTMTTAAAMATTMMAAPAALLHVARVPTRAIDKEIQGCPWPANTASKQGQRETSTNTEEACRRRGGQTRPPHHGGWATFNIAEEHKYTMAFERYIC